MRGKEAPYRKEDSIIPSIFTLVIDRDPFKSIVVNCKSCSKGKKLEKEYYNFKELKVIDSRTDR
ncbi:MAG TPA: hypothetical protein VK250_05340 [Nitrososphaeraceae archaeon]|nr:hypothetical protein [Nitrososphaeraceae archaeon]